MSEAWEIPWAVQMCLVTANFRQNGSVFTSSAVVYKT